MATALLLYSEMGATVCPWALEIRCVHHDIFPQILPCTPIWEKTRALECFTFICLSRYWCSNKNHSCLRSESRILVCVVSVCLHPIRMTRWLFFVLRTSPQRSVQQVGLRSHHKRIRSNTSFYFFVPLNFFVVSLWFLPRQDYTFPVPHRLSFRINSVYGRPSTPQK